MTIRIYGRRLQAWYEDDEQYGLRHSLTQVELEYKDYDSTTGAIVGSGTEDIQFGPGRNSKNRYSIRYIYTWDGEKRSKGYTNNRTFDYQDTIYYRPDSGSGRAIRELMKLWHPTAADIDIRSR